MIKRNNVNYKFSLRKQKFGLATAVIGLSLFGASTQVLANTTSIPNETSTSNTIDTTTVTEETLINGQTANEVANDEIDKTVSQPIVPIDQAQVGDIVDITETVSPVSETTTVEGNKTTETAEGNVTVETTSLVEPTTDTTVPEPVVETIESEFSYQDGNKTVSEYEQVVKTTTVEYIKESDIVTNTQVDTADIVFIVDHTYSMDTSIETVKNNIRQFVNTLAQQNLKARLGLIDYASSDDVNYSEFNGSKFTSDVALFIKSLDAITIDGGIEEPTTPLSVIADINQYDWLNDNRFAILITDEDIDYNSTGTPELKDTIKKLNKAGISTTVVTATYLQTDYDSLISKTNGKFIDIDSDFGLALTSDIANWVVTSVQEGKLYKVVTESYDFYIEVITTEMASYTPTPNYQAKLPISKPVQATHVIEEAKSENQLPHTSDSNNKAIAFMGLMASMTSYTLFKTKRKN